MISNLQAQSKSLEFLDYAQNDKVILNIDNCLLQIERTYRSA